MTQEPARIISLINAAILATWAIVVFIVQIEPELAALGTTAIAAWVAVAGELIRARVTPTQNVALTVDEKEELERAGL